MQVLEEVAEVEVVAVVVVVDVEGSVLQLSHFKETVKTSHHLHSLEVKMPT